MSETHSNVFPLPPREVTLLVIDGFPCPAALARSGRRTVITAAAGITRQELREELGDLLYPCELAIVRAALGEPLTGPLPYALETWPLTASTGPTTFWAGEDAMPLQARQRAGLGAGRR